jgi:hypothetical protein
MTTPSNNGFDFVDVRENTIDFGAYSEHLVSGDTMDGNYSVSVTLDSRFQDYLFLMQRFMEDNSFNKAGVARLGRWKLSGNSFNN